MMVKNLNIENVNSEFDKFSLSECKRLLRPLCYRQGVSVRTFQQFFRLLYFIRLLRYSTKDQLQSINFSGASKVATTNLLNQLVNIGFISSIEADDTVYIPNEMTDLIVKAVKYNSIRYHKVFSDLPVGVETSNEIKNSHYFVQALNQKSYYSLFFPNFDYLIPDGLLILRENNRYKLQFLEIETEQSNWTERFEKMKLNYERLAKDRAVYHYWSDMAGYLRLPVPDEQEFCFSVIVVCDNKRDLGKGFIFRRDLYE